MKQLITHFLVLILLVVSASIKLQAQCTSVPQVNSVINGDFESGYIASGPGSFTTDQIYVYDPSNAAEAAKMDAVIANPSGTPVIPCAWASDGKFHIASYYGPFTCDGGAHNGHPFLSETDGRYDHTQGVGGTGKYLMIDSKDGPLIGLGITLWEQDVSVVANENYYFSAWFMNFSPVSNGANRVALRFVVEAFNSGGTSLGVSQLGAVFSPADASRGNNWEQAYRNWVAPVGAVTARLGLYNQTANVITGNDVAIDDISFTNGCQDIVGNIPPPPDMGPDINICATNGTITLASNVVTNAGAGRTFTWYSGTGATQTQIVAPSTSANTHNITTPGTYRVCVFEATGGACAKSSTIVITEAQTISLGLDESICQPNSSTVPLVSTLANPGATYSYSWTRNAAAFPGTASTNTATNIGTYVVNATHPTRPLCNATDTKIVNNTNTMTTTLGSDATLCNNPSVTFTSSLTGSAFTYEWLRNGVVIGGATSSSYAATSLGTYRINLVHPVSACSIFDEAIANNTNTNTTNIGADVNLCSNPSATFSSSLTAGYYTYQWQRDGVNIPGATASSYNATIAGVYRLNITHPITGCEVTDVANLTSTNTITPNHATFCAPPATTVNLGVTGTGSFNWYANSSTTTPLLTNSTTFTTPAISTTTTYYVEDMTSTPASVIGTGIAPGATTGWNPNGGGVSFTTSSKVTLTSLDLYVPNWQSFNSATLSIKSGATTLWSAGPLSFSEDGTIDVKTVPIGYTIVAPGTYTLEMTGTGDIYKTTNAGLFPHTGTGLSITGFAPGFTFSAFRNLVYSASANPCARIPVTASHTGSCPAPVTLISFEGTLKNNMVDLSWITTQEINASHYVVERSYNGTNFTAIGTVAANNISSLSMYGSTDTNPGANGIVYYRLVQVDLDGSEHSSEIILVTIDKAGMTVYPNPNKGVFNLSLSAALDIDIRLELLNPLGQVVYTENVTSETGVLNKEIDIRGFSAGVYYLKVQTGSETWMERIVKE
jgi:hypothetical protein